MKLSLLSTLLVALIWLPVCLAQSIHLEYDANGNLIAGDGKYRIYNDLNQLAEVRNGSNSSAPLLERYEYHPIEERILLKDVYENGVWKETVFYDNANFVQVQNISGNYSTVYIIHEGQQVAQQTASTTEYLISDPYGAYKLVTNEFGTIIENTTIEPFGRVIAGGERTRFDYEDREYSSIVGDYDFRFRKYDPNLKIFTQPDTLIKNLYNPKDLNRYAFENNNPYKNDDPTGHDARMIVDLRIQQVTITTTIYIYGNGASKREARRMQREIMRAWNTGTEYTSDSGETYSVNFDVRVKAVKQRPRTISKGDNAIKLISSGVSWTGKKSGYWTKGTTGVAAHEFGHLLGLTDRYSTSETPFAGWEGNIMGTTGCACYGKVDERNINAIIGNRVNKAERADPAFKSVFGYRISGFNALETAAYFKGLVENLCCVE